MTSKILKNSVLKKRQTRVPKGYAEANPYQLRKYLYQYH